MYSNKTLLLFMPADICNISTVYVIFITAINVIFQFTLVLAVAETAAVSGVGMGISFRVPLPS
jgi:hypothetical protein